MRLTIAQPFMAGFAFRKRPKSRPGTAESFANSGFSFVPAGTWLDGLNDAPAINGWAIFAAFPNAVRRGIIVESQTKTNSSPVGAASSVRIPDDVAPNGALSIIDWRCYKDSSPTDLPFAHTPRPNSGRAGQSGPGPAMRWPLAFCPGPCVRPDLAFVPTGHPDNSPAFQRRGAGTWRRVPSGRLNGWRIVSIVARHFVIKISVVPAGLRWFCGFNPALKCRAIVITSPCDGQTRIRPVPAGQANPAPARPGVGRWPFAPSSRAVTKLVLFGIRVRTLWLRDKISAT